MTLSRSARMRARRFARLSPVLLALFCCALPSRAEAPESTPLERRIKEAFLYKFAGYVTWPASSFPRPDTPITIGIAGDERMAKELQELVAGRTSGNRSVSVIRPKLSDSLKDIHILFVGRAEEHRLRKWVSAAEGSNTLVVTESEGALEHGSIINFVLSQGRVRFEISIPNAERNGLELNSGLLAVAKSVIPRVP